MNKDESKNKMVENIKGQYRSFHKKLCETIKEENARESSEIFDCFCKTFEKMCEYPDYRLFCISDDSHSVKNGLELKISFI